ncbi:L,D-transpeptidase [Sphingomonas sabuli]|uniref:L,D-transpeptidase n=1 Tax=Sphingomonas sabuli TaxID=2764186 RepID=A0A7G9L0H9_9SPHN|nr:L,D-transpeptidase [Sphingomonas sabuli]QNM82128.1 L,D-transpeptidase [Sphingomonas sabuli]
MKRFNVLLISAIALAIPVAAVSQGSKTTSPIELARQADKLKPGQWVWAPQIAPEGPMIVFVDLSRQLATVYRNGVRIGVSTVSTGKPGHETPTGVFTILQKDANHHSSKYNNAPMPYQERLTVDGVALHAGGLPGYPESHGCVHLPLEFSRLLFGQTHMGGTVIVAGHAGSVHLANNAGVLAPEGDRGVQIPHVPLAPDEGARWQPNLSPSGPVTIIVSRSDQRVIVLRNGVEIGRSKAEIGGDDFETHVLTYTKGKDGAARWMTVGVPGHLGDAGSPLDTSILQQTRLPAAFRTALSNVIVPGTTILVTQAPVRQDNSGKMMTMMASATNP